MTLVRRNGPGLPVSGNAGTCVATHYTVSWQCSCITNNAVIVMLLRGVAPDLRAVMLAATSDGAPDMLATALEGSIPAEFSRPSTAGRRCIRTRPGCGGSRN